MTIGCWANFENNIVAQAFRQLNPGGWLESVELDPSVHCDDGTMPEDWPPKKAFDDTIQIAENINRSLLFPKQTKTYYQRQGFVNVEEKVFRIPLTDWDALENKEDEKVGSGKKRVKGGENSVGTSGLLTELERHVAQQWEQNIEEGIGSFVMALWYRYRNMDRHKIEVELVPVRRDIKDRSVHAYMNLYCIWGRKPESNETYDSESMRTICPERTDGATTRRVFSVMGLRS